MMQNCKYLFLYAIQTNEDCPPVSLGYRLKKTLNDKSPNNVSFGNLTDFEKIKIHFTDESCLIHICCNAKCIILGKFIELGI